MIFHGIEPEHAILAGLWRRECPEALRTPEIPNKQSQLRWFESLENSNHRYWGCVEGEKLVAVAGLTYISWDNRSAEISLIVDPEQKKKGFGREAVERTLAMGFGRMNLEVIYGECYECAHNVGFWRKALPTRTTWVDLPDRKYWNGEYWGSHYFSVRRA